MTKSRHMPGYVPNPDYSQEDWDEVSDNPELTESEIADALKRLGGRPKSNALAAYKADGPGWQTRMNEALAAGLRHRNEVRPASET